MEKQYDFKSQEKAAQDFWQKHRTYDAHHNPGPIYSIDTPPPTVSGSLHIGHIFSYTQTDIIARYKRMSGFSVFYPFGFDDNGLPTERFVEKKLEITAHSMSRSEFIAKCLQETESVEHTFKELWQKMGLSVNWDLCYSTISASTRQISQESFIELYKKGYIYRRYEPALYCTACRTSVAQAELDDAEKPSQFNDIVFQSSDGKDLIVGTTRPELLPSCVALLYNPADTRYQHLKGTFVTVPIFNFKVPVYEDEGVDIQKGSGLVMCCTFGDKKDIAWYKKFNLPYKQSIGLDGRFVKGTGILEGLKVGPAREKILAELKAQGLLIAQKAIMHAVNVHERCKNEIEYVALSQWFVRLLEYKKQFLAVADQVDWYPAYMKARYKNWVENIGWDWCISRQRFFGIPFPVWHCQSCNEILLADSKALPVDPQEVPYAGVCPKCKSSDIKPDTDVMDTWNTSSLTPQLCYKLYNPHGGSAFNEQSKEFLPMSMRPQAHDIIRTWAFDTIVKSWMHYGQAPWKDIVISGHVLAGSREKLSKSKGGGKMSPEDLLKTYPADVIRYWTASGSLGNDINFADDQLKIGQRLNTKIWNAFRFMGEHVKVRPGLLSSGDAKAIVSVPNQWILHEASMCFATYTKYLDGYEFNLALDTIEKFFWNKFCDNYLEVIKDQFFNPGNYSAQEVAETAKILYTIGLRILQMYAPFLPHITESLFALFYKESEDASLHRTRFEAIQYEYQAPESVRTMNLVMNLVAHVRKLKTEHQLSLRAELETLELYHNEAQHLEKLATQEQLLRGITQAKKVIFTAKKLGTSYLDSQNNSAHIELEEA